MGTTGITAKAFGRKDKQDITSNLVRAFFIACLLALVVILFQKPIGLLSFYLMNVSEKQFSLVEEYFYIRI